MRGGLDTTTNKGLFGPYTVHGKSVALDAHWLAHGVRHMIDKGRNLKPLHSFFTFWLSLFLKGGGHQKTSFPFFLVQTLKALVHSAHTARTL